MSTFLYIVLSPSLSTILLCLYVKCQHFVPCPFGSECTFVPYHFGSECTFVPCHFGSECTFVPCHLAQCTHAYKVPVLHPGDENADEADEGELDKGEEHHDKADDHEDVQCCSSK